MKQLTLTTLIACSAALAAQAQTLDFESLPDGRPLGPGSGLDDTDFVSDQFESGFGITFDMINEAGVVVGQPQLAKVGRPRTAFVGAGPAISDESCVPGNDSADRPVIGTGIGCFFLTDDDRVAGAPPILRVRYSTPVNAASGDLLDIDQQEAWTIRAYGELGLQGPVLAMAELDIDSPGAGNGLPTRWVIESSEPIHEIHIDYTGDTQNGVGLAFDNFSPSSSRPCAGSFQLYGSSQAAPNGVTPALLPGCFEIGNSGVISARGNPGRIGCLLVGTQVISQTSPFGEQLVNPIFAVTHVLDDEGRFSYQLDLPDNPALVGVNVAFQTGYLEGPGTLSLSRGLSMTVGDPANLP